MTDTATTTLDPTTPDPTEVEEVMGRLLGDIAATAGLQMTSLGIRTGLWEAMASAGPLTVHEVSVRTGIREPYVREWLKHQAASGYVTYDPLDQTFELPAAVAAVLADEHGQGLVGGFATMLTAMAQDSALVERAFRTGTGFGWHQRSADHWHGMDTATRAEVVPALVSQWVPALDGIAARLEAGAAVADVGCGYGAALIALAQAYPASRFWGFDYHDASIARARAAATAAGVADRVVFEVAPASDVTGAYDVVLFVDAFHDLGDPAGALRQARGALTDGGSVLLVEFAASDRLEENFTPLGRLQYAASTLVCTPNALAQGASDPLGTIPGEGRLTEVARAAGFSRVRRVQVESPLNLLLQLQP